MLASKQSSRRATESMAVPEPLLSELIGNGMHCSLDDFIAPSSPAFATGPGGTPASPACFSADESYTELASMDESESLGYPEVVVKTESGLDDELELDGTYRKHRACKICGKKFNQPGNLSRHYAVHSQTRYHAVFWLCADSCRPFRCNICGKVLPSGFPFISC